MGFEYPWLILLIVIPLVFLILRSKETARAAHPMVAILRDFESRWVTRLFRVLIAVVIIGFAAAIARPMIEGGTLPVLTRTRDTGILIDKSGSMRGIYGADDVSLENLWRSRGAPQATDPKLSKYGLSRLLALKFMELRKGDRLAAGVFNDKLYWICWPLSTDNEDCREWLKMPDEAFGGTELGPAMIAMLKHLEELGQTGERTLILVSDGDGTWSADIEVQLEKLFKTTNTKLFWIYVELPSTIRYKRRENTWDLSQRGLIKFVRMTGGRMFDADSEKATAEAFDAIAKLQTYPVLVRLPMPKTDLYPVVLGLTFVISCVVYIFARVWVR